jgi:carboxypeptidase Q
MLKPCLFAFVSPLLAALPCWAQAPAALDLVTISRIREEGLNHSHVMEYGSGLTDFVGARLTGSPEFERGAQWCLTQLRAMGVATAREESWGEFGMAWTQLGTSALLVQPAPATFLAQATPWSPATAGEVMGTVVLVPQLRSAAELKAWHGKLADKIILYGAPYPSNPNPVPPLVLFDEAKLQAYAQYPLRPSSQAQDNIDYMRGEKFNEQVAQFFADEHALAVLREGGDNGMLSDQTGLSMGGSVYRKEHQQPLPSAAIASEAYGRMARLLARNVPVSLRLNIQTKFGDEHVAGQNVLGELPGTDPKLKKQVVLLGAHLDSWAAGTGATDDGAGVIIVLEALRILKVLGVQPRRTIRLVLWGGEEQGELGSMGYVAAHLARADYTSTPETKDIPLWMQTPVASTPGPDYANFSGYFNADRGGGRFLGINTEGNLAAAELFRQWASPLADLGFTTVTLRHTDATDSESFAKVGLPAFDFIQSARDDSRTHHTNLDTYERLSEPDLKQAATVMAVFVYNAAQRDGLLPRKAPPRPAAR